jgi:hypothetical protein
MDDEKIFNAVANQYDYLLYKNLSKYGKDISCYNVFKIIYRDSTECFVYGPDNFG